MAEVADRLEKEIDRLVIHHDKITNSTAELDKRISKIETYFVIGLIVGAIFGISGGVGLYVIKSERTAIHKLKNETTEARVH